VTCFHSVSCSKKRRHVHEKHQTGHAARWLCVLLWRRKEATAVAPTCLDVTMSDEPSVDAPSTADGIDGRSQERAAWFSRGKTEVHECYVVTRDKSARARGCGREGHCSFLWRVIGRWDGQSASLVCVVVVGCSVQVAEGIVSQGQTCSTHPLQCVFSSCLQTIADEPHTWLHCRPIRGSASYSYALQWPSAVVVDILECCPTSYRVSCGIGSVKQLGFDDPYYGTRMLCVGLHCQQVSSVRLHCQHVSSDGGHMEPRRICVVQGSVHSGKLQYRTVERSATKSERPGSNTVSSKAWGIIQDRSMHC